MRWDEEAFKEKSKNISFSLLQITQACGDTQESVALILLENPFLCSQIHQKANNETEFGLKFSTSSSSPLTSLELADCRKQRARTLQCFCFILLWGWERSGKIDHNFLVSSSIDGIWFVDVSGYLWFMIIFDISMSETFQVKDYLLSQIKFLISCWIFNCHFFSQSKINVE